MDLSPLVPLSDKIVRAVKAIRRAIVADMAVEGQSKGMVISSVAARRRALPGILPPMNTRELLVEPLVHIPPRHALDGLSGDQALSRLPGAPHSIAEITLHMDFWQQWTLKRCRGIPEPIAASASQGWPAVPSSGWEPVREQFLARLDEAVAFFENADLAAPVVPAIEFPAMSGYTLLYALEHMARHNAHHIGQIVTLRQVMGCWPPPAGSFTW